MGTFGRWNARAYNLLQMLFGFIDGIRAISGSLQWKSLRMRAISRSMRCSSPNKKGINIFTCCYLRRWTFARYFFVGYDGNLSSNASGPVSLSQTYLWFLTILFWLIPFLCDFPGCNKTIYEKKKPEIFWTCFFVLFLFSLENISGILSENNH